MPGTSGVTEGKKVFVDGGFGKRIGFVLNPEYEVQGENGPELKADVQIGSSIYTVGYRAPKDDDGRGSGLTFWLLTDK
jgi:hypothetical protein